MYVKFLNDILLYPYIFKSFNFCLVHGLTISSNFWLKFSKQDKIIVQKLKDKEKLTQEELLQKNKNEKEKTKTCKEQCVFSYLI